MDNVWLTFSSQPNAGVMPMTTMIKANGEYDHYELTVGMTMTTVKFLAKLMTILLLTTYASPYVKCTFSYQETSGRKNFNNSSVSPSSKNILLTNRQVLL